MIGTGVTFAAGVGVVTSLVGAVAWIMGKATVIEVLQVAGRFSVVAFLLGVAFSGVLAITAGGRGFSKLSLRLVSGLGASAGLLYFGFLAMNGGRNWSAKTAAVNFVVLTVMGGGAAAATLLIARRGRAAIDSADELPALDARHEEPLRSRSDSKAHVPRL
jgi:hypothetical protein